MRKDLLNIGSEQRGVFTGRFERKGIKSFKDHYSETILLLDIRDSSGEQVTDHLWFNMTKGFRNLGTLEQGMIIQFEARVAEYYKGYVGYEGWEREKDYKLSHPTKCKKAS